MKIDRTGFGNRTLPPKTTKKVQTLLLKMNSQTSYEPIGQYFNSKILDGLRAKFGSVKDLSKVARPVNEIYDGVAQIKAGNINLNINPKTGEILKGKKPWFSGWKSVAEKIEKVVEKLTINFDNAKIVEKSFSGLCGCIETFPKTRRGRLLSQRADKTHYSLR